MQHICRRVRGTGVNAETGYNFECLFGLNAGSVEGPFRAMLPIVGGSIHKLGYGLTSPVQWP